MSTSDFQQLLFPDIHRDKNTEADEKKTVHSPLSISSHGFKYLQREPLKFVRRACDLEEYSLNLIRDYIENTDAGLGKREKQCRCICQYLYQCRSVFDNVARSEDLIKHLTDNGLPLPGDTLKKQKAALQQVMGILRDEGLLIGSVSSISHTEQKGRCEKSLAEQQQLVECKDDSASGYFIITNIEGATKSYREYTSRISVMMRRYNNAKKIINNFFNAEVIEEDNEGKVILKKDQL
ncbi:hypothetical protein ACFL35_03055 [Candidatus Riflebacteria bacterium]